MTPSRTDDEVFDALRRSLADTTMSRPAGAIVARGRARRTRNRLAAGLVLIGAGAGAVTALPAFHAAPLPAARPATAPWSVTVGHDEVDVVVRRPEDATGLDAALTRAGTPERVVYNQPCRAAPPPGMVAATVRTVPADPDLADFSFVIVPSRVRAHTDYVVDLRWHASRGSVGGDPKPLETCATLLVPSTAGTPPGGTSLGPGR